jgi:hypothetical protein
MIGLEHVIILSEDAVSIATDPLPDSVLIGPILWQFFAPVSASGDWSADPWLTFPSQTS